MSDTPRTDDVVMQAVAQGMRLAPVAELARELERENAAERARLDSGQILLTVAGERVWYTRVDLRAAIDAAMKEAQP